MGNLHSYLSKNILKNIAFTSFVQWSLFIAPLITLPLLTHALGMHGYGVLALTSAVNIYIILLIDFGQGVTATRQLATSQTKGEKSRVFWRVQFTKICTYIVLLGMTLIGVEIFIKSDDIAALIQLSAMLSGLSCILFPNWFFEGQSDFFTTALITLTAKIIQVLIIIFFIKTPADIFLAVCLEAGIGIIAGFILLPKIASAISTPIASDIAYIKNQLKKGAPFFFSNLSISFYTTANLLILGMFSSASAVGNYAVAEKIVLAAKKIFQPVCGVVFPRLMITVKTDRKTYIRQLKLMSIGFALLGSLISIGIFISSYYAGILIPNHSSDNVKVLLQIMSPIPLIVCFSNIAAIQILIPHKKDKLVFAITAFSAIFGVIACFILSSHFENVGAAISALLMETVVSILCIIYALKTLKNHSVT